MANTKKRITLQNLISEGKEIWVRNMTGMSKRLPKSGPVFIQIGGADSTKSVMVPPGKDPVCITDQVPIKNLETCSDLFELTSTKALELLDPTFAEEYYEKNEARREKLEAKIQKFKTRAKEKEPTAKKIKEGNTAELNPRVAPLCQKAKYKSIEEDDMLEELLEIAPSMADHDFAYVASNGYYDSVKEWAKECLNDGFEEEDPVEQALKE